MCLWTTVGSTINCGLERAFASIHDLQTNSHYLPNLLMHFLSLPNDLVFVVVGDKAFELVTK